MWMKTCSSSDIIWFDKNGSVIAIEKNVPLCITSEVMEQVSWCFADNAQYVLEMTSTC